MKKLNSILFCAVAAFAVASCNKEVQEVPEAKSDLVPMTFTATTTETRTALDEDHVSIKWLATDKISVFDGTANRMFTSNGEGTTVKFTGEAADFGNYLAVYPYNENIQFSATRAETTLADAQTPVNGTFADGLNINAALSADKSSFHFENVLSVAKFTLSASNLGGKTIKSVKFASTHPLAGDVSVRISPEGISASAGDNTVNEVTMTSESGLADGTYYFVVLPNAGGEITMTFESTDGYLARKTATLGKAFTAGSIKNLGSVKGLVWTKVFFYESFDQCDGTGGNDGKWSGTIASNDVYPDNEGWSLSNEGGADHCVKLGARSNKGTATTPSIALTGDVKIAFKAGAWDGGSEQTELVLSAVNATITSSSVAMEKGEFTDYDLALNNASDGAKVTFAGKYKSNSRFFLDEVLVYVGDKELAYSLAKGSEEPVEPVVTVEAPAFNPDGGTFTTAQSVTITSSSEGATIYYTTDGNDPTTSTTTTVENGGAVTISSSCTLKAIAVKDGVASSVSSAKFTINNGLAYETLYTSNVILSKTDGHNAQEVTVGIDSNQYDALKAGTGSVYGKVRIVVPQGTNHLHMHVAGWNKESVSLKVLKGTSVITTLTLKSDSGVSGASSTFTLAGDPTDYYYNIPLNNTNDDTYIYLSTEGSNNYRFVVWGVNAEK